MINYKSTCRFLSYSFESILLIMCYVNTLTYFCRMDHRLLDFLRYMQTICYSINSDLKPVENES